MVTLDRREDLGTDRVEQEQQQGREERDQEQASATGSPASRSRGTTTTRTGYKGKALRSWPQLPSEVIRLIATYHLLTLPASLPLPAAWDVEGTIQFQSQSAPPSQSPQTQTRREGEAQYPVAGAGGAGRAKFIPWREARMYTLIRDAKALERFMCVCPAWGRAVEYHDFWHDAIGFMDPTGTAPFPPHGHGHGSHSSSNSGRAHDTHSHSSSKPGHTTGSHTSHGSHNSPLPPSPYTHFRAMLTTSCAPCLVNAPHLSPALGLHRAARTVRTVRLGGVGVCREHAERRRNRWCGVCLWDGEVVRMGRTEALRVAREGVRLAEGAYERARWAQGAHAYGSHATNPTNPAVHSTHAAAVAAVAAVDHAAATVEHARGRLAWAEDELARLPAGDGGVLEMEMENVHAHDDEYEGILSGVGATCKACRAEWVWREAVVVSRAVRDPGPITHGLRAPPDALRPTPTPDDLLRALGLEIPPSSSRISTSAIGQFSDLFKPDDAIVRGVLEAFVERGEGTVRHVMVVAGERGWLRARTRWSELMGQAVAARRWGDGAGAGATTGGTQGRTDAHEAARGRGQVVLITREERERERLEKDRRRRARSASLESVDRRTAHPPHAYANNATNAAAYARAGYTTTASEYHDYDLDDDFDDYDDDDSLDEFDDDLDLDLEMEEEEGGAVALEMNVKEMALGDWARGRILDGAWAAPADVYFGNRVNGLGRVFLFLAQTETQADALADPEMSVRAVHPVSWAVSQPPSPPHSSSASASASLPAPAVTGAMDVEVETRHPAPPIPLPPTYRLTESAHTAHCRQLRVVLLPAFRNVVRRIIVECALDAAEADAAADENIPDTRPRRPLDPAIRAARMSLAEVVAQLREAEQVWFDGIDWSETRKNAREQEDERALRDREREGTRRSEGSDDSSAGTPHTSDTSPVLSTSTLGTTPSPPPLDERSRKEKDAQRRELARQPTIAVTPVLNPPRLLRPIPYVPETLDHLPQYSIEALKAVWREACAPLYHCRCSICERAMAAQQAAQGGSPTKATTTTSAARAATPAPPDKQKKAKDGEKKDADGPFVMHIPAEDEMDVDGRGAESVVSLVEDDGTFYGHADDHSRDHHHHHSGSEDGLEGLTAQERYWLQMEEEEGPGSFEREMQMVSEMQDGKWARPGYEGAGALSDEYDDDEYEDEGEEAFALGPAPAAWVASSPATAGRKRSAEELEGRDAEAHQDDARGGTPPKRARTGEKITIPTVRLVKRRSEELDVGERGAETGIVKRARVEDTGSPPDSSTPGTEDSASAVSAYDSPDVRHTVRSGK
ncbi:hypothetical protein DFH06DRAFT_1487707 [Mycena polygramma]|nr:hypothetical protein DFH06DRAFT_1487707 [Mycena polygramma]